MSEIAPPFDRRDHSAASVRSWRDPWAWSSAAAVLLLWWRTEGAPGNEEALALREALRITGGRDSKSR